MFRQIKNALTPSLVKKLRSRLAEARDEIDLLRSKVDLSSDFVEEFLRTRQSPEYLAAFEEQNPLVSVCIATYNRSELLLKRSVASVLGQSYANLEVIVVGDCCTDDTAEQMALISDPRLRFVNLAERGDYPEDRLSRWMVAGTTPINTALDLARGTFITHLDDDDEYLPDRIARMVAFIQETRADLVWHPFFHQTKKNSWKVKAAESFSMGQVTTSSTFYHRWFAGLKWDILAYHYREPGDWNRLRKVRFLEALVARYPVPLLRHFREMNQTAR
jgi:glycosyltransferase involved in cell wall biosynthesis